MTHLLSLLGCRREQAAMAGLETLHETRIEQVRALLAAIAEQPEHREDDARVLPFVGRERLVADVA
jgi:hypothetical protein